MNQPRNHSKNTRLPSTMKHQFSEVPKAEIQRSSFDRSHGFKTTFDAGYLFRRTIPLGMGQLEKI